MENYTYQTQGVCSRMISFGIEDGKLHDVKFLGGCPGNTAAIGKLVEGADAAKIADILRGNDCGGRGTSCADQLAKAIDQALKG
ncbi:MAG: TIGR03905 family TSCPD domain-containing protein [Saccharofermentans sp.]|nr:TIGR03905 family TSCPD domain-containing protein [Saccharofermentans sp.]